MRFSPTTSSRLLIFFAAALALGACTSSGPGRRGGPPGGPGDGVSGGQRGGMDDRRGGASNLSGPLARPVALLFASMDADQDMLVDRSELAMASDRIWDNLSGGDSAIKPLDLSSWLVAALGSADAQPSSVAFDTNLNGQISRAEFEARLRAEFEKHDSSGDGQLERSELVFDVPRAGMGRRGGSRATRMMPDN
ncbi:hypothetical protein [Henriciella sp.]|uniref:EF-hand domain-containing protein n=1 Tax=Henriciella sp. TaxID=1968823 RepID=UPI002633974A|nr:hypothetical protein [Henriciella sp.]